MQSTIVLEDILNLQFASSVWHMSAWLVLAILQPVLASFLDLATFTLWGDGKGEGGGSGASVSVVFSLLVDNGTPSGPW